MTDLSHLMDAATESGVRKRYGDGWLSQLPELVVRESARLGVDVERPLAGGRAACVLKVRGPRGTAVLKLSPDEGRCWREIAALERLAHVGVAPRVLESWVSTGSDKPYVGMLLEWIDGPGSLRETGANKASARHLVELLSLLAECSSRPLEVSLDPVTAHLSKALARGGGGGLHGSTPPTDNELAEAVLLLDELTAGVPDGSWVHGSLHPGNLLQRSSGQVVAVDPRPFNSDPIYDVAELAVKVGSERRGRRHNLQDGRELARELSKNVVADDDRLDAWMRVIVTSGV